MSTYSDGATEQALVDDVTDRDALAGVLADTANHADVWRRAAWVAYFRPYADSVLASDWLAARASTAVEQARIAELDYLLAEVIPHITGTRETLRTILERRRNELAAP